MRKSIVPLCAAMILAACATLSAATAPVYQDRHARFTLINDGTVRLEYAPNGKFVDDMSFVAVDRDYPEVKASVTTEGKNVVITTDKMKITYRKNSGRFTADNLHITNADGFFPFEWEPGKQQTGNLKGTYRTLDGFNGNIDLGGNPMKIEDGLLATDGWTLVDDSSSLLFDQSADWTWVKERKSKKGAQDWYFMAYGHDYKQALNDFTLFAGKVPLPPRYAFGYWWSRYWAYTDNELRELVADFQSHDLPLDVLVIDMDWHFTEPGKGGWTGYTWNTDIFPDPAGLLKFVKDNNLQITMNLHPAEGVKNYEEKFDELKAYMGRPANDTTDIPFEGSNIKFMKGWLDVVLHPMQQQGVDFWWLDWQQWPNDKKIPSLSNTWWLNYTFFSDMERNGSLRPILYHRWGGLGNHRYQIGFSGDTFTTWNSLDFQPYFNSTASNVLYGYWSHDIGGHLGGDADFKLDPEMYIRWMQFGIFSPIFRTHSTKDARLKKEPWNFTPDNSRIISDIIRLRYDMSPYIYTMGRKTYETGLSICRPMYYDYPEAHEAYEMKNEYMFGDNMIVMPVTAPMNGELSKAKIWLPEGDWYEWYSGTTLKGGRTIERSYTLDEVPVFIKAGSIIPMTYGLKNLRSNDNLVTINVFPGGNGEFTLYEDNGNDKNYRTEFAKTHMSSHLDGNTLTVKIDPRTGNYNEMPAMRRLALQVNGYTVPVKATVNGKETTFSYDGNKLALTIDLPAMASDDTATIVLTYPADRMLADNGFIGKNRRLYRALLALKDRFAGLPFYESLGRLESAGRNISYHPERFAEIMDEYDKNYADLPAILKHNELSDKDAEILLKQIGY